MEKNRRFIWNCALVMISFFLAGGIARAEFPERTISLYVGFAPGGSLDLSARALAISAQKILGKSVIIENKLGGTGAVSLVSMLSQKHDGYVLCATPTSVMVRVSQIQNMPFKPLKSFKPIIGYASPQLGILVKNDAPWKTLQEFIHDARKNPGKLTYATTGLGSTTQAAIEEISHKENVRLVHVPYKGSMEAMTALMGGHVNMASLTSEFIPMVQSGQLRLLATLGEERSQTFPTIPTLKEEGYDFANDTVYAIVGPADLDPALAEKLEKAFAAAMKDKQYLDVLEKDNLLPIYMTGKDLDLFIKKNWKIINKHLIAAGIIKQAATPPE